MDSDNLFSLANEAEKKTFQPLAIRMRPKHLDDIVGQEEVTSKGSFLRGVIERDMIPSLLFYGPSGVGKTTIAQVIAMETKSTFITLNAVMAGMADLRKVIQTAKDELQLYQRRTIVFIWEKLFGTTWI